MQWLPSSDRLGPSWPDRAEDREAWQRWGAFFGRVATAKSRPRRLRTAAISGSPCYSQFLPLSFRCPRFTPWRRPCRYFRAPWGTRRLGILAPILVAAEVCWCPTKQPGLDPPSGRLTLPRGVAARKGGADLPFGCHRPRLCAFTLFSHFHLSLFVSCWCVVFVIWAVVLVLPFSLLLNNRGG